MSLFYNISIKMFTAERIVDCVKIALKSENLRNLRVQVEGQTCNGDGYLGDITFLSAKGISASDNSEKIYHLVLKSARGGDNFKNKLPIDAAFKKEIDIYTVLKKAYQKLQREMKITDENLVDFMPLCYEINYENNIDLLLLENLKVQGYYNWDKRRPMSEEHVKIVLEAYAKMHALSFALKEKKREIYDDFTRNNENLFSKLIISGKFHEAAVYVFNNQLKQDLSEMKELDDINFNNEDAKYIFTDLYHIDPDYQVILHGDCWNNNLMFKDNKLTSKPAQIKIIDYQLSGLGSPAIDLSHFVYCCCPRTMLEDFNETLKIYYNALSKTLLKLNCDPDIIYPFAKLKGHWKKCSQFGLLISFAAVKICLAESEHVPDFAEIAEKDLDYVESFKFKGKGHGAFLERMKANLQHYAKYGDL